ncbi:MAG: YqaA family protein [Ferrimonas sp.]
MFVQLSFDLLALFGAAFVSASLFPGGSEGILVYLLAQHSPLLLLLIATIGNTLGSLTSYGLGRWFVAQRSLEQLVAPRHHYVLGWLQRYGSSALLLAWLPIVGDFLPLLAGWLRLPLLTSILMIFIGKLLRYAIVVALALELSGRF